MFKFVYRSFVINRGGVEGFETALGFEDGFGDNLNAGLHDGESLVAMIPYSSADLVTVVVMKRVPVEVTPLDDEEVIDLEPKDA